MSYIKIKRINMAGIAELKAQLADNPQLMEIVANVEATINQNTHKVVELEKQLGRKDQELTEAIKARDKVKEVVRNELGIDEFTPDAIKRKLATFGNEEAIAARERQYNELKAKTAQKMEELESKLQEKEKAIRDHKLKLAIAKTDVMGQTRGEYATDMLMQWISENADFDEQGNIVYRGEAGETLYNDNGNPLTLEDRINQIKADDSRAFIFQERFLKGGGAPTEKMVQTPGGIKPDGKYVRSKMSFEEKKMYREKYGDEAYSNLPLA
jgi:hypothetical protein